MFTGDDSSMTNLVEGDVIYGSLVGETTNKMMSWPNNKLWNPDCSLNLFLQMKYDAPNGGICISGCPDCPENAAIETPLMNQVLGADHEAMITLKGLQYSPTHADLYVDVWWLTRGMSVTDIQYLRGIQNSEVEHFCCYNSGGVGPVKDMLSGYARVLMYSDKYGPESLEEGDWERGNQINFGRVAHRPITLNNDDTSVTFKYFLGWYGGGVGVYANYNSGFKSW